MLAVQVLVVLCFFASDQKHRAELCVFLERLPSSCGDGVLRFFFPFFGLFIEFLEMGEIVQRRCDRALKFIKATCRKQRCTRQDPLQSKGGAQGCGGVGCVPSEVGACGAEMTQEDLGTREGADAWEESFKEPAIAEDQRQSAQEGLVEEGRMNAKIDT